MSLPRVLTVGTGAIGAIYSWRLSLSCHVTTVCRSNFEVVRHNGLKIESKKFGNEIFFPNQVLRHVPVNEQPYDYVLVTLKALSEVYNVADIIAPAVTKGKTAVVLIQNGLGVEEPIVERFPDTPIISVVAYIGTSQVSSGEIVMVGDESLMVGNYKPSPVNADVQIDRFADLLRKGGCTVHRVDDVEKVRWQKLFWNGAFSPVCALSRMNTTEILNHKPAMTTVKNLIAELTTAASAAGYKYNVDEQVAAMLEKTRSTAMDYKASFHVSSSSELGEMQHVIFSRKSLNRLLDLERGQPMEVEAILGTPLRRAKALGVKVPNLEMIYNLCSSANAHTLNMRARE
ncbi:2-dehydropantoate 2-reductase [Dichotomocladium elegans]|nr:2-dehydropantoate 2-reductase [Dichotomocladium elegans]